MVSAKQELVYSVLLLIVAIVWGTAFVLMKEVQQIIPLNYILAVRFTVACLGLVYYLYVFRRIFSKLLVIHGAITGFLLYSAFAVQTMGLAQTTTSKNALITSLYVVLVPFLLWVIRRDFIPLRISIAAVLCFMGVCIISPTDDFTINYGDVLSLVGSFLYAAHIVAVAICSERSRIIPLTCMQFAFSALFAWIVAFSSETFPSHVSIKVWMAVAYLAFVCTLLAMTMMNIGIKYVSSAKTSIILSTEAVFACIFGTIFQNDPVTLPIIIGGVLITGAVIISQIPSKNDPPPRKHRRHRKLPPVPDTKPAV